MKQQKKVMALRRQHSTFWCVLRGTNLLTREMITTHAYLIIRLIYHLIFLIMSEHFPDESLLEVICLLLEDGAGKSLGHLRTPPQNCHLTQWRCCYFDHIHLRKCSSKRV